MGSKTSNMANRKPIGWIASSLLAAVASSACCILPAITVVAGVSGFAASLSWLEPARPFLIGLAILSLSYAWFQKIRQMQAEQQNECCGNCATSDRSFWQSTGWLAGFTVFALLMITFPFYSGTLLYGQGSEAAATEPQNTQETQIYAVEGMTCSGCEKHIEQEVEQLEGVKAADASHQKGNLTLQCLEEGCPEKQVQEAVQAAGYQVAKGENDLQKEER